MATAGFDIESDEMGKEFDEINKLFGNLNALGSAAEIVKEGKTKIDSDGIESLTPAEKTKIKQNIMTVKKEKRTLMSHSVSTLRKLSAFATKKETQRIVKMLRMAQCVDMCFVMDATASMGMENIIRAVRQQIRDIIKHIKRMVPHLQMRLALVIYRDFDCGEQQFEVSDFNKSVSLFEKLLGSTKAMGGGDQCEDVIGGLDKVNRLDWKLPSRILFLCADAPCHGSQYHDGCGDSYPEGTGMDSAPIMSALKAQRVDFTFMRVNSTTDKMIAKFDAEAGGQFITTAQLNEADLSDTIKTSILKSVAASVSKSGAKLSDAVRKKSVIPILDTLLEGMEDGMPLLAVETGPGHSKFLTKPEAADFVKGASD